MSATLRNNTVAIPKAWPFEEAAKVAHRLEASGKGHALFETGYGPSGLPHIGTFGEVARTTWVRNAFTVLTGLPSRLLAFSDDMDGLRKVPDNVPNKEMLAQYLGKPLTRIPDPFGTHDSFGAHNNARLRAFLDSFGFEYEFASSTDYYASGRFDAALIRILECYEKVMEVILPTLGPDRRATYSPILPIHPKTGIVMQVPMERWDAARRHRGLARSRHRRALRDLGEGRRLQAAMEGRLGDALVRARRRLRDVRQGPDRLRKAVQPHLPRARQRAAGDLDLRVVPRRARARRSASRRATASRWTTGCATPRRNRWRSSCSTRRSAPSGCIST